MEPGDNGENVDPLVAEPDQSRDIDDGDNVGVVDGDTSGSQKDGADLSDTEPGDNMGSDNEGDGASYENVFTAGGSADGIGDGTGNGIENAETGSDTQESITDVTSGFTAEQPTTEDPGDQSNGGTDEGEPSPDSDQVGESDAGTESEAQSDFYTKYLIDLGILVSGHKTQACQADVLTTILSRASQYKHTIVKTK